MRRSITLLLCALLGAASAFAQSSKATSIIVPFSAGGQNDVVARIVANPLAEALRTNVIVENLPGAGGVIAARKMLGAPTDGLTIFQGTPSQLVLAGLVNKELALNTADFIPIHMVGTSPYVIFARSELKASNADELAALARQAAKEGKPLTYASVGTGTLNHVLGEELSRRMGAPLVHVPYKGGAEVMRDLAGGQVDIFLNLYTSQQIALADEGRFKFIAALSPGRQTLLPKLPSVDEGTALKGFYTELWIGLFVKAGTPPATVANLNKAMATVLANEKVQQALLHQTGTKAATPLTSPPAVEAEYAKGIKQFQDLARSAGLQPAK
jgi:tripartite-type tricarboxylate transporter receptor subunit TctC